MQVILNDPDFPEEGSNRHQNQDCNTKQTHFICKDLMESKRKKNTFNFKDPLDVN